MAWGHGSFPGVDVVARDGDQNQVKYMKTAY